MILINLIGLLLIALIIWWFWLYKPPQPVEVRDQVTVTVIDGTYQPARIKIAAHQSVSIEFLLDDSSPCASTVVFPQLDISQELAIGKKRSIIIPALEQGEYIFHCPMLMYRGALIVE